MIDVSFIIGLLNKEEGGAQQLLYDLCTHLANDEFDLTVYYMFGEGTFRSDFEATGARVVSLNANSNYDPRAFTRFVRILRRDRPDVLHTNSPISSAWGRIAGTIASVPRIVSVEHHMHDARRPIARTVDDFTLPLADSVVGVSEAVTRSFAPLERLVLDVMDTPVVTISNGVDVEAIDAGYRDSDDILDPYPIEPSDSIIGTVGRHVEEKGYRYLIDAMELISCEHPDAKLLLVGDGPKRAALEQRARRRGLLDTNDPDTVVFAGQQPSVPPFLAHFDVGVFPSIDESFGLALAETMAAGVPVIGSDIPPFRRLLDGGEAGILVPPRDSDALAMETSAVLGDNSRRERLSGRGRERIEQHFSIERTARSYAGLYRDLVQQDE